MRRPLGYFKATRHPWSCLVFLLPLLLAYEGGILWIGDKQPDALRTGADTWLRWGLEAFGLNQLYWLPALVGVIFVAGSWHQHDKHPRDVLGICTGMAIESVVFALGLWGLSRGLGPFLDSLGIKLHWAAAGPKLPIEPLRDATGGKAAPNSPQALAQVIGFVGAGIYEEVLFRLLLFTGVGWLLGLFKAPSVVSLIVAAAASAGAFAAAHHVGPYGEAFEGYVFAFRCLAGVYFAFLYQFRGFGIAVGAHACYDVLVGVVVH